MRLGEPDRESGSALSENGARPMALTVLPESCKPMLFKLNVSVWASSIRKTLESADGSLES